MCKVYLYALYVSVWHMHTCIGKDAGLGGGQTSSPLLHHSLPHTLKIRSLTEPRAMLATSKHQLPPVAASTHKHDVRIVGGHVQLFKWVLEGQPQMN